MHTKASAIKHLCQTVAIAYNTIEDYEKPSDCFCSDNTAPEYRFQHTGETLEYVRQAVIEKLNRDGFEVSQKTLDRILAKPIEHTK